jgi:hypothetical protein
VPELYDTLGFFFVKQIERYMTERERLSPLLEQEVRPLPGRGVAVPVVEVLAEIVPLP